MKLKVRRPEVRSVKLEVRCRKLKRSISQKYKVVKFEVRSKTLEVKSRKLEVGN